MITLSIRNMSVAIVGSNAQYLRIFVAGFNEYQVNYIKVHESAVGRPAEEFLSTILNEYLDRNHILYSCDVIGKYLRGLKGKNIVKANFNQHSMEFLRSTGSTIKVSFTYGIPLKMGLNASQWNSIDISLLDEANAIPLEISTSDDSETHLKSESQVNRSLIDLTFRNAFIIFLILFICLKYLINCFFNRRLHFFSHNFSTAYCIQYKIL